MQFNTEQSTDMEHLHIRLSFTALKPKHLKGRFEAAKTLVKINLKNYLVTLKLPHESHKCQSVCPLLNWALCGTEYKQTKECLFCELCKFVFFSKLHVCKSFTIEKSKFISTLRVFIKPRFFLKKYSFQQISFRNHVYGMFWQICF